MSNSKICIIRTKIEDGYRYEVDGGGFEILHTTYGGSRWTLWWVVDDFPRHWEASTNRDCEHKMWELITGA